MSVLKLAVLPHAREMIQLLRDALLAVHVPRGGHYARLEHAFQREPTRQPARAKRAIHRPNASARAAAEKRALLENDGGTGARRL